MKHPPRASVAEVMQMRPAAARSAPRLLLAIMLRSRCTVCKDLKLLRPCRPWSIACGGAAPVRREKISAQHPMEVHRQ